RDIKDPTLVDVGAGAFDVYSRRAHHAFQITEINNVTTTLNRFAKLRIRGEALAIARMDQQISNRREIRRENHRVANGNDVSGGPRNLQVAADRAMLDGLNAQTVPLLFSNKRVRK